MGIFDESVLLSLKSVPDDDSDFKAIKDKLMAVGVELEIYTKGKENYLTIKIKNDKFDDVTKRKAGRKPAVSKYKYADILQLRAEYGMLENIASAIGMPEATFYRHWRKMKGSWFWEELDQSRIDDLEYLKTLQEHDGNYYF